MATHHYPETLLALDIGAVTTRAVLFDIVAGRYRYVASGTAPTTAGAPYHNIAEGVHRAIDDVQAISGRVIIGEDQQIITPSTVDGMGIDALSVAISVGPPLKIVLVGLLEDVSVESARRLATTTYGYVQEVISLNDGRRPEGRIDTIIQVRPNLVIMAGGVDQGASQSVLKLLETVGLACYLMPKDQRPHVLYAGNQALQEEVRNSLEGLVTLHFAPNIRPTLEFEQIEAAQTQIAQVLGKIRAQEIPGVSELDQLARGGTVSAGAALGRLVRYLSKTHTTNKAVVGVDLGASALSMAVGMEGLLRLGIYPALGLGNSLMAGKSAEQLAEITAWLVDKLSDEEVQDYLANKSLHPSYVPATVEELNLEEALARYALNAGVRLMAGNLPPKATVLGEGQLPICEPIIATGSVFTRAASFARLCLMLLDGLQPVAATNLVLDQNHIAPALGAAAAANPLVAVQVLDSNSFLHLGTVISPLGRARYGTPCLQVQVALDEGQTTDLQVKYGSLEVVPIPYGRQANLRLQPLHNFDIGMGAAGRGGKMRITGGALGLIIDARGRPLSLPEDRGKRRELYQRWLHSLGGE